MKRKTAIPVLLGLLCLIPLCGGLDVEASGPVVQDGRRQGRVRHRRGSSAAVQRITIPPSSPQLAQLQVEPVGQRQVNRSEVVAPGRISLNPNRMAKVLLPLPGRISQLSVQLGDTVRAGQTLLLVESAEADQAVADHLQAQSALVQAQASLAKAQTDLERLRDLHEHQAVALKEVIEADNQVRQASAVVSHSEAAVKQTSRRLEILGLQPGTFGQKVSVVAPLSGKALEIGVTPGEFRTDCSQPLLTIADLSKVWVVSDVTETSIRLIQVGERVEVELVAFPGELFEARVVRISDMIDPQTRTVQVQAEMANPQGRFRPGMFARIRHVHAPRALPVVPATAVLQTAGASYVFKEIQPGTYDKVRVTTESLADGKVALQTGLVPGDRVVVNGAVLLNGK